MLERADATSTALLRAVSHDLRTPLATMRTAVDGLADAGRWTRRTGWSWCGRRRRRSTSSSRLIDNLLDLSRVQSGLVRPRLRPHSLEEILPLAVAGHEGDAVTLELDETAPLVVTDAGLLERVVANLVGNAVRHAGGKAGAGAWPRSCPRSSRSW